jgi:hypothetical protein
MSDNLPSSTASTFQRKVAIAACFGTFPEWYDFFTFASLATYFSTLFFPQENPVGLLTMAFVIGFLFLPETRNFCRRRAMCHWKAERIYRNTNRSVLMAQSQRFFHTHS